MRRALAALLALGTAAPATAAARPAKPGPHLIVRRDLPQDAHRRPEVTALTLVRELVPALGQAGYGVEVTDVLRDGDRPVVRLVPTLGGLPVEGRGAAVRIGAGDGTAVAHLHLDVPGALPSRDGRPLDGPAAEAAARKGLGDPVLRGPAATRAVIWPAATPVRAWVVDLPLSPMPTTLRAVVDAYTGGVVSVARTDPSAWRSEVYETNPRRSRLVEVDLPWLEPDTRVLEGRFADVARCRQVRGDCELVREAEADDELNFFYEPDDSDRSDRDPFAEVSAYWHVNRVRTVFDELGLGRSQLRGLRVWVNVPRLSNAGFSPAEPMMIFGQGQRDFAYDGDVVYHEYTHGVVSVTARLNPAISFAGFDHLPGALNEGVSDQFSTALSGDSTLGEYVGGYAYGGEIRDMDGRRRCPDDLIGQEHNDSQPYGQAAWEVRSALDDDAYLRFAWSVLTLLVPSSGPKDAAEVMATVAGEDLDEEGQQAVADAVERHGLLECSAVIALEPDTQRQALSFSSSDLTGGQASFEAPSYLQFRIEVPEPGGYLRLEKRILGCPLGCPQATWLRKGEPVEFSLGFDGSVDGEADIVVREELIVEIDPIEPGTWYVASSNSGPWTFVYSVNYELELDEPEPPEDAGTQEEGDAGPDAQADAGPGAAEVGEGEEEAGAGPGPGEGSGGDVTAPPRDDGCGCVLGAGAGGAAGTDRPITAISRLWRRR